MIALGIPIAISRSALLVTLAVFDRLLARRRTRRPVRALAVIAVIGGFVFVTIPGLIGTLARLRVRRQQRLVDLDAYE